MLTPFSRSDRTMSLAKDIKRDIKGDMKAAKKMHLSWRAQLLIFVITVPTVVLFMVDGRLALAMPLLIFTIMHALVIRFKWNLRRQGWFWIAIGVSAALHGLLLLSVPWTTRHVAAAVISGLATVDFLLILAIVDAVERFLEGPRTVERGRLRSPNPNHLGSAAGSGGRRGADLDPGITSSASLTRSGSESKGSDT